MAQIVSTAEDIYDFAQDLMDGDEFQSDDAALRSMNVNYQKLLRERKWYFLDASAPLALTALSLAAITDLGSFGELWYVDSAGNVGDAPMRQAPFSDRFNSDYDYWIDYKNNLIVLINTLTTGSLRIDYTTLAEPLSFDAGTGVDTTPVIPIAYRAILSYDMVLDYKKADEALEVYKQLQEAREEIYNAMIDDDAAHKVMYAQ